MFRTTEYLLPNAIRRQCGKSKPYATIVGIHGVLQAVSYADLENFSNRASWILEKIPSDKVLYMGPNDIRYVIWLVAAMKTGKCVLLPSLSNQVSANMRFFETVGTETLIFAPEVEALLAPLLHATNTGMKHIVSPKYEELMSQETVDVYPFEKTFDEIKQTKFLGLHTSGTSGHPKPIFWNHLAVSSLASYLDPSIRDANGESTNLFQQLLDGNDVLIPFPLSHFGGMGNVMAAMYSNTTLVFPSPGTPLTPANFCLLLQRGQCTATAVPPSLLEAMLSYPPGVEVLASLKHIAYTGGPLNPVRGKILAEKLPHLFTVLASTEGGVSRLVSTGDSSHWNSFKFFDVGQRMEEVAPGIFELVYPRSEIVNRTYAFFHTHPHLDIEFRTSDLFSRLGGKGEDGWWVYRGRADNWIAMSNGLKMDPTEMENTVASSPGVKGVLVAGSYRFRLCLLIELAETEHSADGVGTIGYMEALEKIWPTIEAANMKVAKFGQIPRELVMFASPDKPFLRAGKGTIQRRLTIQAYEGEIDKMYVNVEEGLLVSGISLPSSMEGKDLIPFLQGLYSDTLFGDNNEGRTISPDDDLITQGLDSLSSFVLLARLKATLRKYGVEAQLIERINTKLLYSATTVRQLANTLAEIHHSGPDKLRDILKPDYDTGINMARLIENYGDAVRSITSSNSRGQGTNPSLPTTSEQVVVLTGSTGSLGSYILSALLARPNVKKIICLNRGSSSFSTQSSSFKTRGLPDLQANNNSRLTFLQIKPTESQFGLSDAEYALLADEVTHVVHNAYPVNFLLDINSFTPQFDYLLNIMRFAADARNKPEILFVSSITAATAINGKGDRPTIEESVLDIDEATKSLLQQGYARSKYVCERLLADYAVHSGNRAAVLRIGQVCGPISGTGIRFWNPAEWLPSLVTSSKFIGAVPSSLNQGLDVVDWVPVDKLGEIICELVGRSTIVNNEQDNDSFRVFNIVHPSPSSWESLLPAVVRAIEGEGPSKKTIDVVPPSEWIHKLEDSEKGLHVIRQNPAVKLLDFLRQAMLRTTARSAVVDMDNLLRTSETARALQRIDGSHMAKWIKGWGI
ncbi:acetyl-CoA synthetase-like protein [Xylaria cf. heliscus]|nr:acetyl-CoA synthetase-like protein [Xylaria cf. heliscus]